MFAFLRATRPTRRWPTRRDCTKYVILTETARTATRGFCFQKNRPENRVSTKVLNTSARGVLRILDVTSRSWSQGVVVRPVQVSGRSLRLGRGVS